MIRFLVDANLPPALTKRLTTLGHESAHAEEFGLNTAADATIWRHAIAEGFAIISKNEDFARRRASTRSGPSVVWIRLPDTRNAALLAGIDRALPGIVEALGAEAGLVEVA